MGETKSKPNKRKIEKTIQDDSNSDQDQSEPEEEEEGFFLQSEKPDSKKKKVRFVQDIDAEQESLTDQDEDESENENEENDEHFEDDDDDEDDEESDDYDENDDQDDDDENEIGNGESNEIDEEVEKKKDKNEQKSLKIKGLKEDIYGRIIDKSGQVVKTEKYIPPSKRLEQLLNTTPTSQKSAQLVKLTKQLNGLFNRLSTSNMHSICNQITQIFYSNQYTRYDLMETILSLINSSLIKSACLSPSRLVVEHAGLISVLTSQIGIELGASLVQKLCLKLDADLKLNDTYLIENKTADNLIMFLCNLYNFKLFSANLIIDLLDMSLTDKLADVNR